MTEPRRGKGTFKSFLQKQAKNYEPQSCPETDFIGDVMRDPRFRDFRRWEDLEQYMRFYGACEEAIDVAANFFTEWKGFL